MSSRILCLINARRGSQGVSGKNIKMLQGKPLISWSIEVALSTPMIDRVVVSTDCKEIAAVAREWGADVPFLRPDELATSDSLQIDTIKYVMHRLERDYQDFYDAVLLLQPTNPIRSVDDVEACIHMMRQHSADTVITVYKIEGGIENALYTLNSIDIPLPIKEVSMKGVIRQNFEPLYMRAGSVYLIKRDTVIVEGRLYGNDVRAVTIPRERSFDINTQFDWDLVDAWLLKQKSSK